MKNKAWAVTALFLTAMLVPGCFNKREGKSTSSIVTSEYEAEYTLSFNYCNGNPDDVVRKTGKSGALIVLPDAKNYGTYAFAGWSTKYDSSTKHGTLADVIDGNTVTVGNSNAVYYAAYNKAESHTEEQVNQYYEDLKGTSKANHLYYHYYRFDGDYSDWDVWAWSYKPDAGEGAKHDFKEGQLDSFGGAYVDIDLTATYDGGWDSKTKTMGGTPVKYEGATQIGLQIVKTSTRQTGGGFWVNDGSNLYVALEDYIMPLTGGGNAYHVFVVQDDVQNPRLKPAAETTDPFEGDDGTNTTYGNSKYDNIDWTKTAEKTATATDFANIGVGYQIMVSSFADSDGDGFGDIYGITKKLDYLNALGVKALWLTPIQLSDSYHGYDITDYEMVDPKFGSTVSTAGKANEGVVTSATALADYKELIDEAHKLGMKVVMDLVLNHTSTSNKWFVKSANLNEEFRGYYQWGNHKTQSQIKEANSWYQYGDHPYSFYAKFGSSMPELNYCYKTTREAVEDMSVYWVKDVGVDGFRLDAVKHIYMKDETTPSKSDTIILDEAEAGDYSSDLTKNLHFFRELKATVSQKSGKSVFFVGENFDGHAYHVAPYYEAFDSMFDFYSYFNLTSAAATGRTNNTSGFGTASGFLKKSGPNDYYLVDKDTNLDKNFSTSGLADADNSAWNFPAVYKTYNKYRGGTSLPGLFTSNHDIARVINRIAGTGNTDGLQAQGNITSSSYASLEKSADCVKIAELMFPGLTWVYYGDEIGMTGNFPSGKDAKSDYADLYYRQPMKWTASADGEYMTDYYVTGSSMKVEWDEVNKSSAVVPAMTQMDDPNSEFSVMKTFINLKNAGNDVAKALILGSFDAADYASGDLAANVLSFSRTLNGTTVKIAINFNNQTMPANSLSGTVLATYNGATATSLPPFSAIVVKA